MTSTRQTRTTAPRHRPSQAWLVWSVGVLAYVVAVAQRTSLGVMGLTAASHFGAPASLVATFMVLQLAVYALMQVPAGLLLDRWGPRLVLSLGGLLMTVGQALMALSDQTGPAMVARVLVGIGDACTFGSAIRLVPAWFPARQVPLLTQLTGLLGQLGQIASAVGLVSLVSGAGWRVGYLVAAGTGAVVTLVVAVVLRDGPAEAPFVRSAVSWRTLPRQVGEVARHPATHLAFWAHWTTNFPAIVFAMMWGMPFITRAQGRSTATASALMSLYVLTSAVSGPVAGVLTQRHPLRRSSLIIAMIALSLLPWLAVLAWPGRAPGWLLAVLAAGLGLSLPGGSVGFDVARTWHPGHRLGTATGVAIMGGFSAGLVAIEVIGLTLDRLCPDGHYTLGGFRWAMATQLPFYLVGIVGILTSRRRLRSRLAAQGVLVPPWREALARQRRLWQRHHGRSSG